MNNEQVLKNLQNSYESLKYFIIKNNILYFKENDKIYSFPLYTVNINNLNKNIFLIKPRDIYRIIYMLELFNKKDITEYDINFINEYTKKYLDLESKRLDNSDVDENELLCMGIPIYTSYDPLYIDNPCSLVIHKVLDNHTEEIENGKSHGQKLVLKNPNFPNTYEDESNPLADFGKAGFTAIMLIIFAVLMTGAYIALFIANK